jgi:ubiquinone biosynthesis protein Coq4
MLFTTNLIGVTKGIISLLQNPSNILSVYDIEDGLKESWLQRLSLQYVKSDQATAQIIAQRYLAASPCLETLLKLPEDSLGYHYATHLISLNFDPNFYRSIQVNSDTDYLLLRLRQTHDIWHIVTGFGVDGMGELQLKAFELSQTRRPLAIVILLGGLLGALFSSPLSLASLWEEIVIAYNLGKNTRPFLAQKWELAWEKSLLVWRQELAIVHSNLEN